MTNAEIGNRIKYARDLRDVTLDDIARKVGVAKSTIQRYEAGKIATIKIPVVESIAIALNVNPAWIVGKSDDMELPSQKLPKIMQYYNLLNNTGKDAATEQVRLLTLDKKYTESEKIVPITKESDMHYAAINAAHEKKGASKADQEHDDREFMDNDEIWN